MAKKKLGEVLRERGHITTENLEKALEEQQRKVMLLGEVLLQRRLVGKDNLVAALEEVGKVSYVNCLEARCDPAILKLLPHSVALRHSVLPLALQGQSLLVVMAEPQNLHIIDELRFVTGKAISPRFGFRTEILAAIERHYGESPSAPKEESGATAEEIPLFEHQGAAEISFHSVSSRPASQKAIEDIQAELLAQPTPAVHLVSSAIAAAVAKDASDIHIEPHENGLTLRLRVDGVLRELTQVPRNLQTTVISRIKILADMDIAERRKPQDGRIVVGVGEKRLDLRISTLPTQYGEKIVIRLLDPSAPRLRFEDLGMSAETCEALRDVLDRPQGMLLVTGPTGSGKTTTLYAALNQLRSPSVNIVTVEDPVEYMLDGINQVQVHTKAGLTFAKSLRSILRQDPNIIMVGEIRDAETAEVALKAAQTGHLVLSTVHTNDSVAAIIRLLDLGIPPFLIASSITAIMSQRLLRKLCACRKQEPATPEYTAQLLAAGIEDPDSLMYVAAGCSACDQAGYKGRVAVSEMLLFEEYVRESVRTEARPSELRSLARTNGMKTIQEEALEKARQGVTTFDEVLRVVPFEAFAAIRCSNCERELGQSFLYCPYCGTKRRAKTISVPIPAGRGGHSK